MPFIHHASGLGSLYGDPRVLRAEADVYRAWPEAPPPATRYLTLGTYFRRRQYLEGEFAIAGNYEPTGAGYALLTDDTTLRFSFGLQTPEGLIDPLVAVFTPTKPRLRKWMCVVVTVVHQNTDTTIYLQVNGETVDVSQRQYPSGSQIYAPPGTDSRFCIGGAGSEGQELPAGFQLDIAGAGVSMVGAPALDFTADWYDTVRQGGFTQLPPPAGFQSWWTPGAAPGAIAPGASLLDQGSGGVPLLNVGWSDIEVQVDQAPVML